MPNLNFAKLQLEPAGERPARVEIPVCKITVVNKTKAVSGPESISQNRAPSGGWVCADID